VIRPAVTSTEWVSPAILPRHPRKVNYHPATRNVSRFGPNLSLLFKPH